MKHDKLERRQPVLTADEIAAGAEKIGAGNVMEIEGRRAAVWQLGADHHETLEIRGIRIDDPEVNWMGVWIYLSEAHPFRRFWLIFCTEEWPEGWQEPRAYNTNIPLDWKGWRFIQWPIEELNMGGAFGGFPGVTWLKVHCVPSAIDPNLIGAAPLPKIALAGLESAVRTQPQGPRISIEELADDLAIDLPKDKPVEEALLDYFAGRGFPVFKQFVDETPQPLALESADLLLEKNRWRDFDVSLDGNPELWAYPSNLHDDNSDPWFYLHIHTFMDDLCNAYDQTGRVEYLVKGRDLILDWIHRFPVPEETDGGTGQTWGGLAAWHRGITWCRAYQTFLDAGILTPEQHGLFLRALWETAHLLDCYPFRGFNFGLFRESGLLLLTIVFPEFTSLRELRDKIIAIIDDDMKLQFLPDGFQKELSTVYQTVANRMGEVMAYARKTGQDFEAPFHDLLEKGFEVWLNLSRPDGSSVSTNDAGAHDSNYRHCLRGAVELFDRDDFLYVATRGEEGSRPQHDSFMYPYAGYYVMRSGWDQDDRFLFFDGGPTGINHRHEDKLNFDLYAYGQRFIVDPGIHFYGQNKVSEFFGSTPAHNTIMIDGLGQLRVNDPDNWCAAEPLDNLWHHGAVLDIVQACYDKPYATITEDPRVSLTKIEDAVHTRTVLFARPDYFVILDHVAGQGEHTCESLLHFAPIKVSLEADGAVTATGENGAVLHALPVLKDGLYAETICGSTDPMQGWVVCMRKGKRIPVEAPTVIHRKTGALPQSFATVLYPQLAADAPAPKCTLINQDDAGISFTVAAENRTDEWHVAFDKEYAYAENGTEWAGKALLISTRSGGARKVAAVNAKRLALPGEVLVDGFTAFAEW